MLASALSVWNVLTNPTKSNIAAAVYIWSPIDILPDTIPVIGWADDYVALALGYLGSEVPNWVYAAGGALVVYRLTRT